MKASLLHVFGGTALLLAALAGCRTATTPGAGYPAVGSIVRADARLDDLIAPGLRPEMIADGFEWSEGPVWVPQGNYLLFSDIPVNTIYRWKDGEGLRVYLRPAGYNLSDPAGAELGTNGLTLDAQGRLVMADHGLRAITRLDTTTYVKTVLADRYEGRRLNSPNDLVYHSSGALYFTDPPYGLRGLNDSPVKELDFNGVYRLGTDGTLTLLSRNLTFPNGIAFSPDEKTLYVAVSDGSGAHYMAYDVQPDGRVANERIFFDATPWLQEGRRGAPDGLVIDYQGNLFATGPGGIHIFAPDATHLGTIETGVPTANVTFGGPDGSTLYITADNMLLRLPTRTHGIGFQSVER